MYAVPQSPRQAIRMQEVLLALVAARAGALCPHQPTYSQFMYTVSLVSLISGLLLHLQVIHPSLSKVYFVKTLTTKHRCFQCCAKASCVVGCVPAALPLP